MATAPALLADAAREALDDLEAKIAGYQFTLTERHRETFAQFRARLEALFATYSVYPEPQPFDPDEPPPLLVRRWDPLAARQADLLPELTQLFQDLMAELHQSDTELFTDALQYAAEDGYDRTLWQVALAGVETSDAEAEAPDEWDELLRDETIDGMNWADRLGIWGAVTSSKVSRWVNAAVVSGMPLGDTLDGFARLAVGHTQHVAGLFGNEMFRAFTFAGGVAASLVPAALREIWVCRTVSSGQLDAKVCPICARKHLTVTDARPIADSHPGCRCTKVQVPYNYVPTPQSFESFRNRSRVNG